MRIEPRVVQLILAFLAGAVVAVLVATITGAWNGTSTPAMLNTAAIETTIQRSLLTQHRLTSTVKCPNEVTRNAGVVFYCSATSRRRRYSVVVTETNDRGHVTYVVA